MKLEHAALTVDETLSWGCLFAQGLSDGVTLVLDGELGAGKTTLTRGIARGLEIQGEVLSPSYTLMNFYYGARLDLCHVDLYRVHSEEEFLLLGLEDFFQQKTCVVIEWGKSFWKLIPKPKLLISINVTAYTHRRLIVHYDYSGD